MKTFLTTVAALAFSATAFAGGPLSESDTYGSVLFDQDAGQAGLSTAAEGAVADAMDSADSYGSVLYDQPRGEHDHLLASPPAVGDDADDYGSVLYDTGARY